MSYMIYDDNGNIWPPGFKPSLSTPNGPNGAGSDKTLSSTTAKAMAAKALEKAAAESRARWGDMVIGAAAQRARKAAGA